jgi:hypothetical protein
MVETRRFGNWICFQPQVKGVEETPTQLDPLERTWLRLASNCAATQELLNILWNPKVHYLVQESPPLVSIAIQIDPIHTTISHLSMIYFNISHPPTCWSSQWSLSFWRFHQYPICIRLLPIRATWPAHHNLLDLVIVIIFGKEYKLL